MASKKKKTKRAAKAAKKKTPKAKPAKRKKKAAKRKAAKKKAPRKKAAKKAKKPASVKRSKHGQLTVRVFRKGTEFKARVYSPDGGSMAGGEGATANDALKATKALLAGRRAGQSGGTATNLREARLRRSFV